MTINSLFSVNYKLKNLCTILLLIILFLPNGINNLFNGIPFLNKFETILILIILPFLFIFKKDLLKFKLLQFLIFFLILLKIILFFSPKAGIGYKQFFSYQDLIENQYIKTYSTFWNKNYSGVQNFKWTKKDNFPIDWTVSSKINKSKDDGKAYFSYLGDKDFNELSLFYKVDFYLFLIEDSFFKIKTKGITKDAKLLFEKIGKDNLKKQINFQDELFLKKGIYKFNGEIVFKGKSWGFEPETRNFDGKFSSAFDKNLVYLDLNENLTEFQLSLLLLVASIFQLLLFILILFLFFFTLIKNINYSEKKIIFYLEEVLFSILFFLIYYFLIDVISKKFLLLLGVSDGYGSFSLAFTIIAFLFFILIDYKFKINLLQNLYLYSFKYLLLVIGPTFLYFFYSKFGTDIEGLSLWSPGDDWETFQNYSRQIVVDGQWLVAGELKFYFRPGIRYFFAIMHIFFGQSGFAQRFLEAWLIFGSSLMIVITLIKLNKSKFISIAGALIFLFFILGENYRWLIGRGLQEFYCMFLIIFVAYNLINLNLKKYHKIFFIALIGVIGSWLREEHVLIYLSLFFFAAGKEFQKNNLIFESFNFVFKKYKPFLLYCIIISSGFSLIFVRNYYLSGSIGVFDNPVIAEWKRNPVVIWSEMLLGYSVGQLSDISFRLTPLPLLGSFLICILVIFSKKLFAKLNINMGIITSIIAILFPYTFFVTTAGYPPRFTIHFLIIGVIMLCSAFDIFFKRKN